MDEGGNRSKEIEQVGTRLRELQATRTALFDRDTRASLVRKEIPELIRRELAHTGSLSEGASFSARLLAWIELS